MYAVSTLIKGASMKVTILIVSMIISIIPYSGVAALENPVIIYGGVGNLGREAQPCLAALYESGNKKYLAYTEQINSRIRGALSKTVLLPSSAEVIVGRDQLNNAVRAAGIEFTGRPTQLQIKEFLEDNEDNLLTLAIVGSFETYLQNPKKTSKGTLYEESFIVGVTAILVQSAGDNPGQIVLTGSSITQVINEDTNGFSATLGSLCSAPENMPKRALDRFVAAYGDAAERAIGNMVKSGRTAGEDSDSVIVTGVSIDSKPVRDLFSINLPEKREGESICYQTVSCDKGDNMCQTLVGLVAFGVTDAFSSRGYLAVPPLNWSSWGKTAEYQATKNVKLTGGRKDIGAFITVNVGPDSADQKLLPSVIKFAEVVQPVKRSKYLRRRLYMGWMNVHWEETEFGKCGAVEDSGDYKPKKKSYGPMVQTLVTGKYLNNEPPLNIRQYHYIAALMRAMGGLRNSLDEAH